VSSVHGFVLRLAVIGVLGLVAGCGSTQPPEAPTNEAQDPTAGRRRGGPTFESEIGALDEAKVAATFKRLEGKLTACYAKGTERLSYLAGKVKLTVRVAKDGSARWAFMERSDLGDRETEACMLGILKAATWPKPEGGEGMARNEMELAPGGDERPPVSWSADQLGPALKGARAALADCQRKAGTKALTATLYVEPDGKAAAVGVSGNDEKAEDAVSCVVQTLRGLKFSSPGSWAAKATITIE
jgi:hypothetical protein